MRHLPFHTLPRLAALPLLLCGIAPASAQQAYIKASNTGILDLFGQALAVSGDTLVVGAYQEDSSAVGIGGDQTSNGASNSGAAYVFVRSGSTWTQQAYLKASNTDAGDEFGRSVAISGDTIVVGAWREASAATGVNGDQADDSALASGAAYVFVRSGTTWTQQAYLKASNTRGGAFFGFSVALSGNTLVVGSHGERSNATGVNGDQNNILADGSGAAYVFVRNGSTWSQQAYLKASNTGFGDFFGFSVAVSGHTAVVCAPNEDSEATGIDGTQSNDNAADAGAAYVFTRAGTTWSQQAYVKASNTGAGDLFGNFVAAAGDTIVLGAPSEDSFASGVNGDQSNDFLSDSGAAYVFTRAGTTWSQQAYLKASNPGPVDWFGWHVSVALERIVVGAPFEDSSATGVDGNQMLNNAMNAGAGYLFERTGTTWSQQAYLKASNTETLDNFGYAAGLSGNTLVLGAYNEDSSATGVGGDQTSNAAGSSGAVYAFDLDTDPIAYCFGDGSGSACPCGNVGATGNGCPSSVNTTGANLAATGSASAGADTLALHGSGMPDSSALFFQGTAQQNAGLGSVFGDGLRCAAGAVIRLGTQINSGGASQFPAAGDPSVSVQGSCAAGDVRTYQVWYRNAASFCTPFTFNLTNGVQITWMP